MTASKKIVKRNEELSIGISVGLTTPYHDAISYISTSGPELESEF
jgi:hypothetical protein